MSAIVDGRNGKLRLLLIGPLPPPLGGATVSFQHLVAELRAHPALHVRCLNSKSTGSRARRALHLLRVVVSAIRGIGACDVVSLHASSGGYVAAGWALRLACRVRRKRFVGRIFGSSIQDVYRRASSPMRAVIRSALRADCLLLQTTALVEYFRRELPGVSVEWFPTSRPRRPPPPARAPGTPVRLLFAGHVRGDKGVGVALDALPLVAVPVELHVFGRPEDASLVRRVQGTPGAFYHGECSPESLVEAMGDFDTLVMPTYYAGEGYPGIVIEAFANGLPVVATRWRDIPEVVEDGVNGLLIPVRSAVALARAVEALVQDGSAYRRLSAQAYQRSLAFDSQHWNGRRFLECIDPQPARTGATAEAVGSGGVERSTHGATEVSP